MIKLANKLETEHEIFSIYIDKTRRLSRYNEDLNCAFFIPGSFAIVLVAVLKADSGVDLGWTSPEIIFDIYTFCEKNGMTPGRLKRIIYACYIGLIDICLLSGWKASVKKYKF